MHAATKTFQGLSRLKDMGFNPTGILDIGAHNGDWSRGIRSLYPECYILMIDGLHEKHDILQSTCSEIGFADFEITLLGADDQPAVDFIVVNAGPIQTGSSKYRENTSFPQETRRVPQNTLSSLLAKKPDVKFNFVKLDVQGAEIEILSGYGDDLLQVDAMLLEVSTLPYNENAPLCVDVIAYMSSIGFVLFDILDEIRFGNGCLFQFDALFARADAPFRPMPPY